MLSRMCLCLFLIVGISQGQLAAQTSQNFQRQQLWRQQQLNRQQQAQRQQQISQRSSQFRSYKVQLGNRRQQIFVQRQQNLQRAGKLSGSQQIPPNRIGRSRAFSSSYKGAAVVSPRKPPTLPAARSPQVLQTKAALRADKLKVLRTTLQVRLTKLKQTQAQQSILRQQREKDKKEEEDKKKADEKLAAAASPGPSASPTTGGGKRSDGPPGGRGLGGNTASGAGGRNGSGPPTAGGGSSNGGARGPANDNHPITISATRRQYVMDKHMPGGSQTAGKSVFNKGENIDALLQKAQQATATTQNNGRIRRVVDAGRPVGIDILTGKPTNMYTVVTERDNALVTMHPGLPDDGDK